VLDLISFELINLTFKETILIGVHLVFLLIIVQTNDNTAITETINIKQSSLHATHLSGA